MNTEFDVVIVANGEFPTHEIPLGILKNAKHIVACDGAIKNVPQAEVVVGDGDSVPAAFHDRLIQIEEQEDNDFQGYALLFVDEMAKNCVFGMHG